MYKMQRIKATILQVALVASILDHLLGGYPQGILASRSHVTCTFKEFMR